MSSEYSTDKDTMKKSSPASAEVSKETETNGDAQTKSADMTDVAAETTGASGRGTANGSGVRNGSGLKQGKRKKGISRRSVTCIVLIVIFTFVAVLDVANHLTTASASTPAMDGISFDGTDFDFSDLDSSDLDASDFDGMMPGGSDSGAADSDSSDDTDSEDGFGGRGSGGRNFDSSDSDFDPSDMDSSDFDSDSMPSGGGSFTGGSDSGMSFPGSSDSADGSWAGADSDDSEETTGSTQRVVANIRSALNSAWIPILVACVLGDAAAVTALVLGIQKEKQAEMERINAARAKRGLPPLESGGKSGEKKEADGLTVSQRKRLRSRRAWRVALALLLIVVIVVAAFPSLYNSGTQTSTLVMVEETLDGTVTTGTIDTTLSGSGTLTAEDAVEQTVPSAVTVDEYYVENGDTVEEGDLIATVNLTSVQLAIQELQADLDSLDADLAEEGKTTYETSLTATASGRVKVIYAEEDVSVIDTMNDFGALMLISVDGLMQAEVTATDDTTIGDSVTVTLSDGTEVTGRVANIEGGVATITLSDEEVDYGDEVTVTDADGNDLGSDTLTIHSELKVTNYYGTVESVSVSVDDKVAAGDELLVLTDVGTTAEYQSLLEQREDLEEQMTALTALMQDNHIYAESTGIVSGISDDATIVKADTDDDTSADTDADSEVDASDSDTETEDDDDTDDEGENTASLDNGNTVSAAAERTVGITASAAGTGVTTASLLVTTGSGTLRSTVSGSSAYAYTLSTGAATDSDASDTDADSSDAGSSTDSNTDTDSDSSTDSSTDVDSSSDSSTGTGTDSSGSGSSSGSSSGSGSSILSGEFKTVTSDLGTLDSLVSTGTDADTASNGSASDFSGLTGTDGTTDDFSSMIGSTDSADASDILSALTEEDSTDGTESGDSEALLAALEEAGSTGTGEEETTATYSVSTTTVLSITPTDTMTISISIDELDILSVETGQTAEITLDALSGQSFTGMVTSIDTTGTNSGGSTKYTAEITLDRTSQMLTGMNATARITLAETEDILVIPVAAIYEEGNKSYVYTTYDEETETLGGLVEVETGVSDGTNVEITSGLAEGDTYYYVYTENITYSIEASGNFFTNLFGGLFGN